MEITITILVLLGMLILLAKEIFDPLKVFVLALAIFLCLGYISLEEAVSGFSNKGVLAIGGLFIMAGAIERSELFYRLTRFDELEEGEFKAGKLFLLIMGCSAFLNNTPIVSLFIPVVGRIGKKTGISPSKLLIPLSYLSALGGILTLIGTSTNLVISGLMENYGMEPFGFFELTRISLPCSFLGFLYIFFFYRKRLPDRQLGEDDVFKAQHEHLVRFIIHDGYNLKGKTVKEAGLRSLEGVYLVEIQRRGESVFPVTPEEILEEGDLLIFAGQTDCIDELKRIQGLRLETDSDFDSDYFNHKGTLLIEAVLVQPMGSRTTTIKDMKFRQRFGAVVIGIIRGGERIPKKLGSIVPRVGDIFLMITEKGRYEDLSSQGTFSVIHYEERRQMSSSGSGICSFLAFFGTIFITLIFGLHILYSTIIGLAFLLITDTIQVKEAIGYIEYRTMILISTSFAIGSALMNTGTASFIAGSLEDFVIHLPPIYLLILTFLITSVLTTLITNNAAAILAVPIVYEIIYLTGYAMRPFMLMVAIAASSSFLSPFGYQTNTMVYGAGGYKFKDFFHFGYPLLLIMLISSSIAIWFQWSL